ncbi:MAG: hypothetical protein JWM16_502 [Verrucomicrobiales bacterium]|nr:hypothetical protein [Verrucomicrobiales bacterium]
MHNLRQSLPKKAPGLQAHLDAWQRAKQVPDAIAQSGCLPKAAKSAIYPGGNKLDSEWIEVAGRHKKAALIAHSWSGGVVCWNRLYSFPQAKHNLRNQL